MKIKSTKYIIVILIVSLFLFSIIESTNIPSTKKEKENKQDKIKSGQFQKSESTTKDPTLGKEQQKQGLGFKKSAQTTGDTSLDKEQQQKQEKLKQQILDEFLRSTSATKSSEDDDEVEEKAFQIEVELTPELLKAIQDKRKELETEELLKFAQFEVTPSKSSSSSSSTSPTSKIIKSPMELENSNSYLFSSASSGGSNDIINYDKNLNGRDKLIQGQMKRGYHLIEPAITNDKKQQQISFSPKYKAMIDYTGSNGGKDIFEYRGGDIDIEKSISLLKESAEMGNHRAMFILGQMEEFGESGTIDFKKASEWYHKSAEYGNTEAQNSLGFFYGTGKGVELDEAKSILYYTFAAKSGHMVAKLALAYRYFHGYGTEKNCFKSAQLYEEVSRLVVDDYENRGFGYQIQATKLTEDFLQQDSSYQEESDVVDYFKYSASIGDPSALVTMANLYLQGSLGVNQDFRVAFEYYREAADQNYPAGIAGLGFMYSQGYGVPQDNKTAIICFKKAFALGHLGAQANLAEMYLYGYGVEQNPEYALKLFNEAAEKGDIEAQINLGKMYASGIHVPRDVNKAFQYLALAAQRDNSVATYYIAKLNLQHHSHSPQSCHSSVLMYKKVSEKGPWAMILTQAQELYDEGDEERSLLLFEKAAEMGIDLAQNNAGWMYDKRVGVYEEFKEDFINEQAFRYYLHSSEQLNPIAHLKIGDYFYYGKGVEMNAELAADSYQSAASLSDAHALFNLGYMHQFGKGRPQDLFLAKRYYDMSLQVQQNAYIPIYLSLIGLLCHFTWFYLYSFINPSIKFTSNSGSSSSAINNIIIQNQQAQQAQQQAQQSQQFSNENIDNLSYQEDFVDFQTIESTLIIIFAVVIGYLLIRRQRIIFRQAGNNQQQRPHQN